MYEDEKEQNAAVEKEIDVEEMPEKATEGETPAERVPEADESDRVVLKEEASGADEPDGNALEEEASEADEPDEEKSVEDAGDDIPEAMGDDEELTDFDLPKFLKEVFEKQEALERGEKFPFQKKQDADEKKRDITLPFDISSRKKQHEEWKQRDLMELRKILESLPDDEEAQSGAESQPKAAAVQSGVESQPKAATGQPGVESQPKAAADQPNAESQPQATAGQPAAAEAQPGTENQSKAAAGQPDATKAQPGAENPSKASSQGEIPRAERAENAAANRKKGKRRKKKTSIFRKLLLCAAMGLAFGIFGGIGFYVVWQYAVLPRQEAVNWGAIEQAKAEMEDFMANWEQQLPSGQPEQELPVSGYVTSDVSDMVAEVIPAMVSIVSNSLEEGMDFFGREYSEVLPFSASGIILGESDTELLVATNYHVVENTVELEVTFVDGYTAEAQVKGTDSDMDLAVIAISLEDFPEETKRNIAFAKLGNSDAIRMGEPVVAIGNALGYGLSMTGGYVSAPEREVMMEDGSTGIFIQTDAAINPGNSGGALLNMKGEVIGINSSKIGDTLIEGIGFAIPISAAEPIISDLMSWETRHRVPEEEKGYLGISMKDIDPQLAQVYGMPSGVLIDEVLEGTPAEEAGLYAKDIIVRFDGRRVTSIQEFQNLMEYYSAGTEVTVVVMRLEKGEYQETELSLTLGSWPESEE